MRKGRRRRREWNQFDVAGRVGGPAGRRRRPRRSCRDWRKVWHLIGDKWDKREPCPDGALRPFNIDAKLNGGYVALGLLYGNGDFWQTMEVATRSGQDSIGTKVDVLDGAIVS